MTLETEKIVELNEPFSLLLLPQEKFPLKVVSGVLLRIPELPDLPFQVIFRPTLNGQRWRMVLEIDKLSSLCKSDEDVERLRRLGLIIYRNGDIYTSRPKIPNTNNSLTFNTYTKGNPEFNRYRMEINLTETIEATFKDLPPLQGIPIYTKDHPGII